MMNWGTVGSVVGIFAGVVGLFKYVLYLSDKSLNEHKEVTKGRFKDHAEKIKSNTDEIKKVSEKVVVTREEMKSDFVRHEHLDKQMDELRETNVMIFERLNDISDNLNQLIGAHNGKVKDEDG